MAEALSPTCKLVVKLGTGLDNIDIPAFHDHGIRVSSVADYATPDVVAQAVAMILALERQIIPHHRSVATGRWDPTYPAIPRRLSERRVGLVGYGRIGQGIAKVLQNLYGPIAFYDPNAAVALTEPCAPARYHELTDLVRNSDVIVIACDLNDSSRQLIDAEALRQARRTAILVNVSRGAVVSQTAVVNALEAGLLAGYAADVFDPEPPCCEGDGVIARLCLRDDVVFSAHRGFLSETSRVLLRTRAAELVREALIIRNQATSATPLRAPPSATVDP
jgi:D-3-phosphoglycerate dehydrogenase